MKEKKKASICVMIKSATIKQSAAFYVCQQKVSDIKQSKWRRIDEKYWNEVRIRR